MDPSKKTCPQSKHIFIFWILMSFQRRSMSFCWIWLILMGMVWAGTLIDFGKADKVFALKRYIVVIPEMATACAFAIDKK